MGRRVVVMGVSGSGKSTVGAALADRLGLPFAEGDDLHTEANRRKMASGIPLDDADRMPWIDAVGQWLCDHPDGGVITCSALRASYRIALRAHASDVVLISLSVPPALAANRVASRKGHFMPASLVASQFDALEPVRAGEFVAEFDASSPIDELIEEIAHYVVDADFFMRYGPWDPLTLDEVAGLFAPIGIDWWIAGGVAAEAFHGVRRPHDDVDVSIFRRDVPALRAAIEDRYSLWSAGDGMLRPLDDRFPEPHERSDQVWIRPHALAPWRADIVLNADRGGDWVLRREPEFAAPLADVTWTKDGVRYLKPQFVLAFKAQQARPKDQHDFAAIAPLLDDDARAWLAGFLERKNPDHEWRRQL